MPEIGRLIGDSSDIELEFVDKEETPKPAMKLGIRLHLAGLSLADTVAVLADLGVDRVRSTVHNWRKKADLQPASGYSPDHVAVDETVIQLNDERYWLYAAVDPATNRTLHARLFPTRTIVTAKQFLTDLIEKHDVSTVCFSSMVHPGYTLLATTWSSDFGMSLMEIGTPSNAFSSASNAAPINSARTSATPHTAPPNHGSKHTSPFEA
jgi:hypothetical protein